MTENKEIPGLLIREETANDHAKTERVIHEAFFNRYAPGCSEHYILHLARQARDFESWHSLVAEYDGHIIGQVLLVPSIIRNHNGDIPVFTLGPVCALPACHGQGVGSALIRAMIQIAKEKGVLAIFLMGDPRYYHRFGFVSSSRFGIFLPGALQDEEADFFMTLPLYEGALDKAQGVFYEGDIYKEDEKGFREYDKAFPQREKLRLPGQLR